MGVDCVTTVGFATTPFSVFPFDFSQFSSFSAVGFVGASGAAPTILVDSTIEAEKPRVSNDNVHVFRHSF